MTTRAVHWYEGMFLRPQHFMAAERHLREVLWQGDRWCQHFSWGLRSVEIDRDALADHRLVIGRLHARLRDGTQVCVPEDGPLPSVDLHQALRESPEATVFLACPVLTPWRPNVAEPGVAKPGSDDLVRYLRIVEKVEDENLGGNPRSIDVRQLNLRLLVSDREADGYETIPIARIRKSSRSDTPPQLDEAYIPPVVACNAWAPLQVGILQSIHFRIGSKLGLLASQAESRGISFDSRYQGDAQILAQIRELNESHAALGVIGFIEGVHPLSAYLELCRIAGRLAIFGPGRRLADLPRYDHDDLGGCFFGVKRYLDELLDFVVEPAYKERAFVGAGMRMQVDLEPAWVEPKWRLFIGVRSSLPAQECVDLLTEPGRLDMKVSSSDQVDTLYRLGRAGLHFRHAPYPPRVMPAPPDTVFFQIDRDRHPNEWVSVQKSLTLAIRLNEKLIAGDIRGKQELTIKGGQHATTMQFILYVVPDREQES
jgi:type VI secretion system protein ImpJ